jgi:hypothetical protein
MLGLGLAVVACGGIEGDLADHVENVEEILDDNMDDPADGVEELEAYVIDHLGEITALVTNLFVELYEIDDADDVRDRLKEVEEKLKGPMESLQKTWAEFERKARSDKDAQKEMQRIQEKLTRLWSNSILK